MRTATDYCRSMQESFMQQHYGPPASFGSSQILSATVTNYLAELTLLRFRMVRIVGFVRMRVTSDKSAFYGIYQQPSSNED